MNSTNLEVAGVRIEPLSSAQLDETTCMLARAFASNPLHVAAFGGQQLAKNEAFFRTGLSVMKGEKYVALDGASIVGFIHWVQSPHCQFSALEKLRMVPSMVGGFGIRSSLRVSEWLAVWSPYDLRRAHLHLGPIGVDPTARGRRVGHQLMKRYCDELDQRGLAGYLETDRAENVDFYRRFGFATTAEAAVLGVRNFFMTRPHSKMGSGVI